MAEENEPDADELDEFDEMEELGAPRPGSKKMLIIVGAVVLLLGLGLGGAYFFGLLDPLLHNVGMGGKSSSDDGAMLEEESADGLPNTNQATFLDLDEMLVNLNTGGRKASYLKIRLSLALTSEADLQGVQDRMPRIIDSFQTYLRELRIEDLSGSEGMYRLREELLRRVNAATAPIKVDDVLFKEMLVQ